MGMAIDKNISKTGAERPARPKTLPEINEFRRLSLIEGCIQSMAEFGVGGTTVKTICEAAGASRGLINHYYPHKEDLVAASLRHLYDSLADEVAERIAESSPKAYDRLHALPVNLFSDRVFTERNCNAFLAFWHEVRFNAAVRSVNRDLYKGYIQRVEALFDGASVELGVTIDTRRATLGFIVLSDGLWLGMSIHDKISSPAQAIETCRRYIDRELKQE